MTQVYTTLGRVIRAASKATASGTGFHDTVKLRGPPKASATAARRKVRVQHQGNDLGDGNNAGDATMDDP